MKKIKLSNKIMGAALALGFGMSAASAIMVPQIAVNSGTAFDIHELAPSCDLLGEKDGDHKCGEHKCGEGKCGEGKCGEGKCGEGKKH